MFVHDASLPAFEMIQYSTVHYFQVGDIKVQALTNCATQQTRQLFYFVQTSVLLTYHSQRIHTFIGTYDDAHFVFLLRSNIQFLGVLCLLLIKLATDEFQIRATSWINSMSLSHSNVCWILCNRFSSRLQRPFDRITVWQHLKFECGIIWLNASSSLFNQLFFSAIYGELNQNSFHRNRNFCFQIKACVAFFLFYSTLASNLRYSQT